MELIELKIACYLYNQITKNDESYLDLVEDYKDLDLNNIKHISRLLDWLRSWGCRQFKKTEENTSIKKIKEWYNSNKQNLPDNVDLLDYDLENNRKVLTDIFNNLSMCVASQRDDGALVKIGNVGTAKMLFALRPNLFAPWDNAITKSLQIKCNGNGYFNYLSGIRNELNAIKMKYESKGANWINLFDYLEKKHKSYPKLIDEYYWITKTKKIDPKKIFGIVNDEH